METKQLKKSDVSRIRIAVLFLMVFAVGAVAGSIATKFYIRHQLQNMMHGNLSKRKTRIIRVLSRRLDLTPEQRRKIERIITQSQKRLIELRNKHFSEVSRIFDETSEKIKAELTPAQQAEFDKMYAKLKRRGMLRRTHKRHRRLHHPW